MPVVAAGKLVRGCQRKKFAADIIYLVEQTLVGNQVADTDQ